MEDAVDEKRSESHKMKHLLRRMWKMLVDCKTEIPADLKRAYDGIFKTHDQAKQDLGDGYHAKEVPRS